MIRNDQSEASISFNADGFIIIMESLSFQNQLSANYHRVELPSFVLIIRLIPCAGQHSSKLKKMVIYFLAPSGAQGVRVSVRLSDTSLSRATYLHLSLSGLSQVSFSSQLTLHTLHTHTTYKTNHCLKFQSPLGQTRVSWWWWCSAEFSWRPGNISRQVHSLEESGHWN